MTRPPVVLLLAGLFGLAIQLLFFRERVGLNLLIAVALFLALAWRLRRAPIRPLDAWIPAFALGFAGFAAVRTDAALVAFDVVAALGLCLATTALFRGIELTRLPLPRLIWEGLSTTTATLGAAAAPLRTEAPRISGIAGTRVRTGAGYAMGAAMAIPFLFAFGFLFTSADAVFARWMEEVLDIPEWLDRFGELKDRGAIAIAASWLAGGAFAAVALLHRGPARPWPAWPRLSVEAATAFLLVIDLLFAAFVSFQISYLFGGRDTVEAAGISYSEYARRGFFELVAVVVIVAVVLFALELALGRRTRVHVAAGLALIGLTSVTLASSLYRMGLYQLEYGWSELRFYVLAALAFLACALLILGWALAARRMHIALQPIGFAALAVALAVNAVGPSALIARANIERTIQQASAEPAKIPDHADDVRHMLDRWYLVRLGDGALPEIVGGLDDLGPTDRFCVQTLLLWHVIGRDAGRASSWQSWNLDRERAREAMARVQDELFALISYPRDDYATQPSRRLETRYVNECQGRPPVSRASGD